MDSFVTKGKLMNKTISILSLATLAASLLALTGDRESLPNRIKSLETRVTSAEAAIAGSASTTLTVEANTGTLNLAESDAGKYITNTGDTNGSAVNLPNDPTAGVVYSVGVTAAQTITLAPNTGETLYLNASSCTNLTSATVGSALSVVAAKGGSGGIWIASGTGWACN